jgi:hypothetical protein
MATSGYANASSTSRTSGYANPGTSSSGRESHSTASTAHNSLLKRLAELDALEPVLPGQLESPGARLYPSGTLMRRADIEAAAGAAIAAAEAAAEADCAAAGHQLGVGGSGGMLATVSGRRRSLDTLMAMLLRQAALASQSFTQLRDMRQESIHEQHQQLLQQQQQDQKLIQQLNQQSPRPQSSEEEQRQLQAVLSRLSQTHLGEDRLSQKQLAEIPGISGPRLPRHKREQQLEDGRMGSSSSSVRAWGDDGACKPQSEGSGSFTKHSPFTAAAGNASVCEHPNLLDPAETVAAASSMAQAATASRSLLGVASSSSTARVKARRGSVDSFLGGAYMLGVDGLKVCVSGLAAILLPRRGVHAGGRWPQGMSLRVSCYTAVSEGRTCWG